MHLLGRRPVLDQFDHPVAEDDGAFGCADIPAHLESLGIGEHGKEIAAIGLDVADEILQPLDEAFAIGLDGAFERVGVGGQVVGRRDHVHHLPREMLHALALVGLQPLKLVDRALDRLDIAQVLLLDEVEVGMAVPERILEAAVFRRGIGRHLDLPVPDRLLEIGEMPQGLAPVGRLLLDQLRGIVHRFLPVGADGAGVKRVPRRLHGRIGRALVGQRIDQPLGQLFHFRDIFGQFVLLGRLILKFCCHRELSSLLYCSAA